MKTVYQLNADGLYVGPTEADPDPMDPENFLIPGGCVEIEPPEHVEGKLRRFVGGVWGYVDAPAPAPESEPIRVVTMRQARLALLAVGLLDDVEAAIDALPDPQRKAARIEWEYSQEVHRDRPFVQQLGAALGLDDEALDAWFEQAAGL